MQQLKMVKVNMVRGKTARNANLLTVLDTCEDKAKPDIELNKRELLEMFRSWEPDLQADFLKFLKEYVLLSREEKNEYWRRVIPELRRLNIPSTNAMADKLEQLQAERDELAQEQQPRKVVAL